MKTLILYYSKTGSTQQYARWLAQDLGAECVPYEKRKGINLNSYDTIAFGGRLHAGTIQGAKWFLQKAEGLPNKKLALFFTGAMPPEPEGIARAVEQNIPQNLRGRVPHFYLWAGLNYEKMGLIDKMMMAGLRKMLSSKKAPTPEDKEMLRMVSSSFNRVERENLRELEAYLRGE